MKTNLVRGNSCRPVNTDTFWWDIKFFRFTRVMIVQTKCKFNNAEKFVNFLYSDHRNLTQKVLWRKQREHEKWHSKTEYIDVRKEKDLWLNAIKTKLWS